ncbi:MAG TPA: S24/S26 family peptidase [Roseiflexaceae bacterium]
MVEQLVDRRRRWRATCEIYRQERATAWIKPEGRSMRPLIGSGAWALVEFGAWPAGVGEIVLFGRGDLVIAHRLVAWRPGPSGIVAKGDAEAYCDAPLDLNDIFGVVRALRRGPDGPATSVGCTGRPARAIARVSWWGGRGAALARRAALFLPAPLRQIALRAIPPLARVAAQALLAPFSLAARIQAVPVHGDERR